MMHLAVRLEETKPTVETVRNESLTHLRLGASPVRMGHGKDINSTV